MNYDNDQKAVAVFYDGKTAPKVTATGTGQLADDIIAIARECGVPLFENPELTALLGLLDLGDEIPHNLYITIAQVIAFAYALKGKTPEGWQPPDSHHRHDDAAHEEQYHRLDDQSGNNID